MVIQEQKYLSFTPASPPEVLADLNSDLCIFKDEKLEVWFAPLGKTNTEAQIAIYGITPGWTQMRAAYKAEINRKNGKEKDYTKIAFAGSMRKNLVTMLDDLKIQNALNVESSSKLFQSQILHSSSVLKYPVFKKGKNYTGSSPSPIKHPFLEEMLKSVLANELKELSNCLIIPLGKTANECIQYMSHVIDSSCYVLEDFPHPSGANGHRLKQFNERKYNLTNMVQAWTKIRNGRGASLEP